MGTTIVASGDAAPVFQPTKPALAEVPSLVKLGVVGYRLPAVGTAGNAGFDPAVGEGSAEAVAVITLLGDQSLGVRQGRQQGCGTAVIVDLALNNFKGLPLPSQTAWSFELSPPRVDPIWRGRA